jgi:hypothetical protein
MKVRMACLCFLSLILAGCTSITVQPVDRALALKHVCIQENPKVTLSGFIAMLQDGFSRHGISTEVISGVNTPTQCEYVLTYTALRSWDLTVYLTEAELRLEKDGEMVASAIYHLKGKGGFSLVKWAGVKSKMDPVIDELLKNY